MKAIEQLTQEFVEKSVTILGENLVGIYLHGSAVMGCFNSVKSDIDLILVVNSSIPVEVKRQFMDMVVFLNDYAPQKGIELSIVTKDVCKPFIYPTPFDLHFSIMHLNSYKTNPVDYVQRMNGVDKDLAAHFTIINNRGKCLYGKSITEVFESVKPEYYFDSIWEDICNAKEDIISNPTYVILNLCRVLAYKKDSLVLSKKEGGEYGLHNVPQKYHNLINQALTEYVSDKTISWDLSNASEYALFMLEQIKDGK